MVSWKGGQKGLERLEKKTKKESILCHGQAVKVTKWINSIVFLFHSPNIKRRNWLVPLFRGCSNIKHTCS